MFNFLSQGLLGFIFWLNGFFNDFGLSIIIFTLILKFILFPLEFLSFLEEEKLKRLRPKINEVLKKYKNDFLKQVDELNDLYRQEKYNPFLTLIFQFLPLPIFLSIFITLNQVIKTVDKEIFLFNSIDLTQSNIFLASLVIIFQIFFIFRMDKEQRKIALIFFGMLIFVLIRLPSIFTLYWLVNLVISLLEKNLFLILEKRISTQDQSTFSK